MNFKLLVIVSALLTQVPARAGPAAVSPVGAQSRLPQEVVPTPGPPPVAQLSGEPIREPPGEQSGQPSAVPAPTPTREPHRDQQRIDYRAALRAIAAGDEASYTALLPRLQDYPLLAYVEIAQIGRRTSRLDEQTLAEFGAKFPDSPLLDDLLRRWLQDAALSNDWAGYLRRFDARLRGTELVCWRLEALYRTGAVSAALDALPAVWGVPRPLPKACDAITQLWRSDRGIPQELIWRRTVAAVGANDLALAQQLIALLRHAARPLATRLISVHDRPELLRQGYLPDTEDGRDVIADGLGRLARSDATAATQLWLEFQQSHHFSPQMQRKIELDLVRRAADQDRLQRILPIPVTADGAQGDAVEAVLRYTIRHQRWPQLIAALRDLPPERQAVPRWRYWLARARQLTTDDALPGATAEYTLDYQSVAGDRSYYGFLAADRLHQAPNLGTRITQPTAAVLHDMAQRPGVLRTWELAALNDYPAARREWRYALADVDRDHQLAAATLAANQRLYRLSIQAVIDAGAWDAIELRFPTAFADVLPAAAAAQGLDPSWVYAIARQESAFVSDAHSAAGAQGLMQLMPGTGAGIARTLRIPLQPGDLLQPALNIRLGTFYLAEMYRNFGYHRALAAAAYNAGPGRVREWLEHLPVSPADVWIESIPFEETQHYVQNVLVYAHIYSRMLGTHQPFLFDHER